MLFSTALLGAAAAFTGLASGQSTQEKALAALQEAQDNYPVCAKKCMAPLIKASNCSQTDITCLCTNEDLNLQIAGCVLQGCTTYEGLQTKNVSMTMCGQPVRDKSIEPLAIGMVFGGLALLTFILRILSKFSKGRVMGMDDWMMIANVVLAGPPTAFAVTLVNNGLGKDMWTLPLQNIKNVLMYYYFGEIFYFAAITTTKLSILFFILRVFPDQTFRRIVYGVGGICVAYGLAFVFATAFQCSPVEWSWQQVDDNWGTGTCNNIHLQGWMSAIFNIVIDLILLGLPLKHLWGLQMKLKKKLMIMFMFSLGIFVTIISVIRLRALVLFANSANISWDYTEAAWWSTLEIHIGIICACLPAVRQLFISLGASILGSSKGTYGSSKGYYSSKSGGLGSGKGAGGGSSMGKGGDSVHALHTPKHGDESDFVPLVDMEYPGHSHRGLDKGSSTYSVGGSYAHNAA